VSVCCCCFFFLNAISLGEIGSWQRMKEIIITKSLEVRPHVNLF
jgi:hypothetical protein